MDVCTAAWITSKDLRYSTWKLFSVVRSSLNGEEVWRRTDTCIDELSPSHLKLFQHC